MPFETKAYDLRSFAVLSLSCLRNAISGWTLFLSSWITEMLRMLLDSAVFFFMAIYVAPSAAQYVGEFGGDYAGYIVVGFLVGGLLNSMTRCFYNAVATGYWGAYWEFYGSFPLGIPAYLTGASVFNLVVALIRFTILTCVGIGLFGIHFAWGNLGAGLLVLGVGLLSILGLGLAAASTFFLLNSKGWNDPVSWLANTLASLLCGVYFPPEVLPQQLRQFSDWLPHFHILRSLRLTIMAGVSLDNEVVRGDLRSLALMAAVLLPVGFFLFLRGLKRAERLGEFTRWT